jgi:RNA polymerase sigma factor (sigma-70 family)
MRIAKNVCIDNWRKRRPEADLAEADFDDSAKTAPLENTYQLHIAVETLREEMKKLSIEQRRCLELKIDGYSYEETAAQTGLSIEAVKSHLQNGRRMLWTKMEGKLSQLR